MKRIGVIGNSVCSEEVLQTAEEVGREIGERKAVLICGGLTGVMEAAARGAKSVGGLTVGIIPTGRASDANQYIDIPVVTGIGYARNVIVVQSSQVVIAIGGRYGTLSEIAYALQFQIPVIGLHTWDVSPDIMVLTSPREAVEKAFELLQC